jgi:hypothetical protein
MGQTKKDAEDSWASGPTSALSSLSLLCRMMDALCLLDEGKATTFLRLRWIVNCERRIA